MVAAAAIILVAGLVAAHRGWLDEADDDRTPFGTRVIRPATNRRAKLSAMPR